MWSIRVKYGRPWADRQGHPDPGHRRKQTQTAAPSQRQDLSTPTGPAAHQVAGTGRAGWANPDSRAERFNKVLSSASQIPILSIPVADREDNMAVSGYSSPDTARTPRQGGRVSGTVRDQDTRRGKAQQGRRRGGVRAMERSVSGVNKALTGAFEATRAKTRGAENDPPAPSKPELFDAVRRMGGQATELGVASILEAYKATSEKTRVQYRRIVKRRMLDHGGRPDLSDISRSSWYPTRAALRAGLAGRYQMAKRDYDKQVKAGDLAGAARASSGHRPRWMTSRPCRMPRPRPPRRSPTPPASTCPRPKTGRLGRRRSTAGRPRPRNPP